MVLILEHKHINGLKVLPILVRHHRHMLFVREIKVRQLIMRLVYDSGNVTANLDFTNTTVIPTTSYDANKTFTVTVISDPVSGANKFVLDGNSSLPNLYIKEALLIR